MLKAYKYRLYPNKNQRELINKHLGACRWLYNYGLHKKIEAYTKDKTTISRFDLQDDLPVLKRTEEYKWLAEVNSLSLQAVLRNLDSAYKNFFRDKRGFPNFKSKKSNRQSFHVVQNTKVTFGIKTSLITGKEKFSNGTISIPKIKNIKAVLHRKLPIDGEIKTSTISRTPTGKYFISILVDTKESTPIKPNIEQASENQALAFDLGIKSFLVASNQDVIDNPKFLKRSIKKVKHYSKLHSKKVKGSNNRTKSRLKLARLHEKVTNQRTNFLHQTTSHYIKTKYVTFCFEDLNVKGMVRNHKLAQAINDVSWTTFVNQLTYKCDWNGKNILKIGRFEPSSKLCNKCGKINHNLTLKDRIFICPDEVCDNKIDRDYQASLNILNFALNKQNLVNDKLTRIGKELAEFGFPKLANAN